MYKFRVIVKANEVVIEVKDFPNEVEADLYAVRRQQELDQALPFTVRAEVKQIQL
jgi:hypothetical protein